MLPVCAPCISIVDKDDGAVVLDVPDDTADGLVDGTGCLLAVPVLTGKGLVVSLGGGGPEFSVEVVFLQDYLRIGHLRVGYSNNYDATGCII